MPHPQSLWTPERDALLRRLFDQGVFFSQMAGPLGCTRNAALGRAWRLGLRRGQAPRVGSGRPHRVDHEAKRQRASAARAAKLAREAQDAARLLPDGTLAPLVIDEGEAPATFLGLTLMELERGQCRWPRGEGADIRFCGQPVRKDERIGWAGRLEIHEQSYCAACCNLAYSRPRELSDEGAAHVAAALRKHTYPAVQNLIRDYAEESAA